MLFLLRTLFITSSPTTKSIFHAITFHFLVQERLTKQIATAILQSVHPTGVGVVIEAWYVFFFRRPKTYSPLNFSHMCMVMRGVQKINATTSTSCMLGVFRDDPKTREEFLALIKK